MTKFTSADMHILKNKIKRKIWDYIKPYFYENRILNSQIILNLNKKLNSNQKSVLICYLTEGYFRNQQNSTKGRTITNEIFKIVKVFSDLGFSVDIINYADTNSLNFINRDYSIIFGFGEAFFLATKKYFKAISILYMAENHPKISFLEEEKRVNYFYQRHGKKVNFSRSGSFYKREHLDVKYSHVITLSEEEPLKGQYEKVYTIFPTGLINSKFQYTAKNHILTKNNFLWFGSFGAIHKGLDLLIDVFSKRDDIILHICGLSKLDKKVIHLPKKNNIIDHGFVDVNSDRYLEIVDKCTYSMLPSCSEACSTSITTSMLHGLIPVVIRNSGFNRLTENAVFLEDYKVEYLESSVNRLINIPPNELEVLRNRTYDYARKSFSNEEFEKSFNTIIQEIVNFNI